LELNDIVAAQDEAVGFARDIMRQDPDRRDWSNWTVHVTDEQGVPVLKVEFSRAL
jgi:hypothetical protein